MNLKLPEYSSSTLENLISKTEKGSINFRTVLSRCKDFITKKVINNWKKKTLDDWAIEDFCWACTNSKKENIKEDLT